MKLSNPVAYKHLPPRSSGLQRHQLAEGHRFLGRQSTSTRAPSAPLQRSGLLPLTDHTDSHGSIHVHRHVHRDNSGNSDQHFQRLHNNALTELSLAESASLASRSSASQPVVLGARQQVPASGWTQNLLLEGHLQIFTQHLFNLAGNEQLFNKLFLTAFGTRIDAERLEALRQRILNNDFSWLPEVKLLSAAQLQGADGAYASQSNTVFLSNALLADNPVTGAYPRNTPSGQDISYRVLVEEIGHAIDHRLNTHDTIGDEGALFSALFVGDSLSQSSVVAYQHDDDRGVIEINGELVTVEHSWLSQELGRVANRARRLVQSWAGNLRGFINFLSNAREAVDALASDIRQITITVLKRPVEVAVEWKDGLRKAVGHLMQGHIANATNELRDAIVNSGQLALSLAPELTAMSLNSLLLTLDRLRGGVSERGLFAEERAYLFHLFGDSIDYDEIIIVTGGFKQQLGMDAHVVGNQIFMPKRFDDGESILTPENTLTTAGLRLLGHEAAHVWQFQQEGSGYITESLVRQLYDGERDTYSWFQAVRNGTAFVDMNVERQAEVAALIGVAVNQSVDSGGGATLTLAALNAAIGNPAHRVSEAQFYIFIDAYHHLNPTSAGLNEAINVEMELNQ